MLTQTDALRCSARQGLTLIQLLIAIAVIGTLAALAMLGIQSVRAAAARASCANNLKQIGLACHAAHDQYKRMPPAFGFYPANDIFGGSSGLGNVFFHLLPYLEQQALYQESHYQSPVTAGRRQQDFYFYTTNKVHQRPVAIYNCPADPTLRPIFDPATQYARSSYAANYLVFGNVNAQFVNAGAQGKPRLTVTFPDGASNTILFAEKYASAWISAAANGGTLYKGGCHWAYFQADCQNPLLGYYDPGVAGTPRTDPHGVGPGHFQVQPNPNGGCNPCLPATGHSAMNVSMADGSVRSLTSGMAPAAWWALMTPAGGEVVDLE